MLKDLCLLEFWCSKRYKCTVKMCRLIAPIDGQITESVKMKDESQNKKHLGLTHEQRSATVYSVHDSCIQPARRNSHWLTELYLYLMVTWVSWFLFFLSLKNILIKNHTGAQQFNLVSSVQQRLSLLMHIHSALLVCNCATSSAKLCDAGWWMARLEIFEPCT